MMDGGESKCNRPLVFVTVELIALLLLMCMGFMVGLINSPAVGHLNDTLAKVLWVL